MKKLHNFSIKALSIILSAVLFVSGLTALNISVYADTSSSASSGVTKTANKLDLYNERMLRITGLKSTICSSSYYSPYLYNFNDKLTTGKTSYDYLVPIETNLYGIKAEVTNKTKLNVTVYNNSDKAVTLTSSYIEDCSNKNNALYMKNKLSLNKAITIDASTLPDFKNKPNLYRLTAELKVHNKTVTVYNYFFTNIDEVKLAALSNQTYSSSDFKKIKSYRKAFVDKISTDKIKPSEQTSVNEIYYPYWHFNNPTEYRCDTNLWSKLAKTIVNDKMSDELKVWTFYEWITNNIAYDTYRNNLYTDASGQGSTRAALFEDYSGKQSTYNLRTGACIDYANILAIFCRTYKIPAIVVSDTAHAWNAIYLNGRWIEIDCTPVIKYYTPEKDVTIRKAYVGINVNHKYDFDPTMGCTKRERAFNKINKYLCTDKIYVR